MVMEKAKDRCAKMGLSIQHVPIGGKRKNIFVYWALFEYAIVLAFVRTFVGKKNRRAQEDAMLYYMLYHSVSDEFLKTMALYRSSYVLETKHGDEHCSGLLYAIILIRECAVTTAYDPDLIRQQLAKARYKLADYGYDIKQWHKWLLSLQTQLASSQQTSTDIVSHMMTGYRSHPDADLVQYVERIFDEAKDAGRDITPTWLIKKAEGKADRIKAKEDLATLQQAEDIQVLESRVQAGGRPSYTNSRRSSGGGRGRGNSGGGRGRNTGNPRNSNAGRGNQGGRGRGRSNSRSSGRRKKYLPPPELRNKPKPSNPDHKEVVRGMEFYWCDNHTWCSHKTPDCKKPDTGINNNSNNNSNSNGNGGGRGDRNGRRVSAFTSLIQRGQSTLETVEE